MIVLLGDSRGAAAPAFAPPHPPGAGGRSTGRGFTLRLRYLWFTIPPAARGGRGRAPAGSPAPEEGAGPGGLGALKRGWNKLRAILRREGLEGFLQSLLDFTQAVKDSSQRLLRHVKLKRFDLYLCVAGEEDAAQGAVLYGKVSAGVYAACGALFGLLPCRKKGVTVDLDYGAREHRIRLFREAHGATPVPAPGGRGTIVEGTAAFQKAPGEGRQRTYKRDRKTRKGGLPP